jgi:D-psicose/D-tagatose/L-ribulose 3-epimerase
MKIGMNLLLWTGHVTEEHVPVLKALKAEGFDGVEVPVFDASDEAHYRWLASVLDDLGLERTIVALIPDEAHSPLSSDAKARAGAVEHLTRVIGCGQVLGAQVMAGPWFQPLGDRCCR